jgi:hypothetical protein
VKVIIYRKGKEKERNVGIVDCKRYASDAVQIPPWSQCNINYDGSLRVRDRGVVTRRKSSLSSASFYPKETKSVPRPYFQSA